MDNGAIMIFKVGKELGDEIVILLHKGTYLGNVEHSANQLENGMEHPALDGEFRVDENDGTLIPYRIPDLDGTPNTLVLGDNIFDLANGRCFVFTPDYQAKQLPVRSEEEALKLLTT